jgi:hypothetical protein
MRDFVLDILTGSDAAVAEWRDRLGRALAPFHKCTGSTPEQARAALTVGSG